LRYCTIDATKLTTDRHEASRPLCDSRASCLRLDDRHDLKLQPNWDRRNNNDDRACLSAPFITSLVSQSR